MVNRGFPQKFIQSTVCLIAHAPQNILDQISLFLMFLYITGNMLKKKVHVWWLPEEEKIIPLFGVGRAPSLRQVWALGG